jgi:molybdenum cofactor synthesis domain-containing protein
MTPIIAVAITVSDRCFTGEQEDISGATLVQLLREVDAEIIAYEIVSDDPEMLSDRIREYAGRDDVNLIITTGGTGFGPRDNTPEVTKELIERDAPGVAEAMRAESLKHTPTGMLSRGVCGIRSDALIVNLPGSPKAVREGFAVIRPVLNHVVALLAGKTSHEKT